MDSKPLCLGRYDQVLSFKVSLRLLSIHLRSHTYVTRWRKGFGRITTVLVRTVDRKMLNLTDEATWERLGRAEAMEWSRATSKAEGESIVVGLGWDVSHAVASLAKRTSSYRMRPVRMDLFLWWWRRLSGEKRQIGRDRLCWEYLLFARGKSQCNIL